MKVIQVFTREELAEKIETYLSGTALHTSTVTGLIEVVKFYDLAIDLDNVKNKEAYTQLVLMLGIAPKNVSDLVRCAVFVTTGSTLVVKNSSLYDGVKHAHVTKDQVEMLSNLVVSFVNEHGIDVLARGSNQYRKLLILLRHHLNTDAKRLLNKAMKRAKVTGSGFTQPIVNSMFDTSVGISDKVAAVENLTTAQIIRILEADRLRHSLTEGNVGYTQYRVRNSKVFIKEIGTNGLIALDTKAQKALYSELVERFRRHYESIGDTVFIPEQVDYAIPSSLKNMVGSFPEFTKFSASHSASKTTVGVYWDWNADIDLHAKDVMGSSIGWNSSYNDGGITYSGDMTGTNKYGWAAEYFALSGDASGVFIDVQMYSSREGKSGQSARVILSTANLRDDFVDLSKALVQFPLTYTGERNMGSLFVSSTDDGRDIYLIGNTASMSGRVPNSDLQEARAKIYQAAIKSKIYLREILEAAGINVVTETVDGAVDLSPEIFSADKVIVP